MGILRFLIILFAGLFLLRLVNMLKMYFKQGFERKGTRPQGQSRAGKRTNADGVTIDVDPRQGPTRRPKVGEYVDFEEIKD